ncbi:MAG: CDP-archaeol synthase [Methylococcales bacterium]|nr:CDP-archaeol synthase [Methylococcales bacterium]
MFVVKFNWLPLFNYPIDSNIQLNHQPLFGKNKTWRGVLIMVLTCSVLGSLQGMLFGEWAHINELECLDYLMISINLNFSSFTVGYLLVNLTLGTGYILGELPNSLIKRQLKIAPGQHGKKTIGKLFLVIDHLDSVIFSLVLLVILFNISWALFFMGTIVLGITHYVIVLMLYSFNIKKSL